ncbi:MAG: DUF5916 domain-containing protein [Brumimicrobium sp.]
MTFLAISQEDVYCSRDISATRISEEVNIDGYLNESVWNAPPTNCDFTQIEPDAGAPSTEKTEVRVLYDDEAIYIGAHCYADPEDVSRVLSQRDQYNSNTDYFSVMLDTYKDHLNGFVFSVSTEGVQYDAKIYSNTYNEKLNMIWYSEVTHSDSGYTVEMKIPYSAIRFSKKDVQSWGINFTRYISINREEATWKGVRPDLDNIVTQAGTLKGIKDITPPPRIFFSPYLSAYLDHYPNPSDNVSDLSYDFNGGMDLKYGINEAFTLDMVLVPDFGQVVTDNVVLNLSPFEVYFDENRPFFNEGTELFEKTGHFYSRRVGGQPVNRSNANDDLKTNEIIISNPNNTPLFNATKVSGRNKKGLGIGVFNGISGQQHALIEDTLTREKREVQTSPFSNYNVIVLDKNLKQNSSITFTNTNVWRSGETYDANVSALQTKLNSSDNKYFISSNTALSQQYHSTSNRFGHNLGVNVGKQTGNFRYQASYLEESDTYDPNDLGFLTNNNKRNISSTMRYNIYKPFWKLNSLSTNFTNTYSRLYNPDRFVNLNYSSSTWLTNRKFHSLSINFSGTYTETNDFFEPRTPGYFFVVPVYHGGGLMLSSNYQKPFALDASIDYRRYSGVNWSSFTYDISPRFRIGNNIFLVYSFNETIDEGQRGYAIPFIGEQPENEDPIFGKRDVRTTTNTIDLNYTINNKSGVTFRLRHYWSRVNYDEFYSLNQTGGLDPIEIETTNNAGLHKYNTSFNAFSIDMVYRWIFSPASEINIVWKNNIFTEDSDSQIAYFQNLEQTLRTDQLNSISLRLVYFIDYLNIKKIFNRDKQQ